MYGYLTELVDHLYITETTVNIFINMANIFINSGSIIDHCETSQFIIPVSERHYLMKRKKLCMWDRSKIIILLFYLKNLSILSNQI